MKMIELYAYDLVKKEALSDINSTGYLLRHKKSGARLVLLENDDENKVFSVGFRTPPPDSTGVAHILEHSVLCGSKAFPAKDPFVELVKGSLNTFLNAMTFPDKTMYPVASCNKKDFQNLMHVYMDAVFYPNIYTQPEIFYQEGWSYNLESKDDKLSYNGVVYNEMKGAFSSPEGVLDRVIMNSLFPDTCYAKESGGDPDAIPELTYEMFLDFHRAYYHPSNSYIYLYGDMDMTEKLLWLDEHYLSHFSEITVDSEIALQEPFKEVRELEIEYSIAGEESEDENTFLSYNKVIGTSLDEKLDVAFQILDYALLSAPGAPLMKALVDAGIGKDILGSYDNGTYQPVFSVVAKNADLHQKEAFVRVIEDTLRDIVTKGMDKKALLGGINYHEFRFREADFGGYPKGLIYGLELHDSWLYDDEQPFIHLHALPIFAFLKEQIETRYFEDLIKQHLLDNPHGSIVIVKPDKGRTARLEKELEEKLQAYKSTLTEDEQEELIKQTKRLIAYQEEGSTAEELEKIPVLERSDLSLEISPILNDEIDVDGITLVHHQVETNGIGYLTLQFKIDGVAEEKLPFVGMLQAVLGLIDTSNYEYGELFNEVNIYTGGISTSLEFYSDIAKIKEKSFIATYEMKGKALYEGMTVLVDMMREILMESKLEDEKRLKEILGIVKSRLQMGFQSSGHTTAALRALSYSSLLAKCKDDTSGIGFYQKVKMIEEDFEQHKEELVCTLKELAKHIFRKENLLVSYTSSKDGLDSIIPEIKKLKSILHEEVLPDDLPMVLHCSKKNEGFKTSSKVQYVARVGNFIDHGAEYHGALQILKVIMSYDYLWLNIRVKGGAYGCFSNFNRAGEGFFISYRDPNLEKTLAIYEGVVDYLRNFSVSERDMTKYIIGTLSNMDRPMTPAAKGERSMSLYMHKITEEMIRQERMEVLSATQEDIRKLAEVISAMLSAEQLCVVGSEEKIESAKEKFGEVKYLF